MSLIHFDTDSIEQYFTQRLREKLPTKMSKIINHIKRERNGKLQHDNYAERINGKTEQWELAKRMFNLHFKRLGFEKFESFKAKTTETAPVQQKLF